MAEAKKNLIHENLTQALAAFQAELPSIGLDAENPHFKSKFASLSNVTKEVLPLLAKQGLAFSTGTFVEEGKLILDAHLLHESGTSRSAQFIITETNPQKIGSSVTYFRRYALTALTGVVADTDDDGNAASTVSQAERQINQARPAQPKPKPKTAPADSGTDPDARDAIRAWVESAIKEADKKDRKDQANAITDNLKKAGKTGNDLYAAVASELGV